MDRNNKKLVVIALGGNAIAQAHEQGTAEEQMTNVATTCRELVKMNELGYLLLVTHGNGPQAGSLMIQQEEGKEQVPAQPLDIVSGMTQGQIGYMFQHQLQNEFLRAGKNIPICTVVTQVLVDPEDPDFQDPSKPVGPFYTAEKARQLQAEKGYVMKQVKPTGEKTWRRVVPSPEPQAIVEAECLHALLKMRVIPIAAGGGGIPVMRQPDGTLKGLEGVIDKDKAGNILAQTTKADIFLILTDVEHALINYGKPEEQPVATVTVSAMEQLAADGHFLKGSMGPKIEAAIRFVKAGGERAIITSLAKATAALAGQTGTIVVPD